VPAASAYNATADLIARGGTSFWVVGVAAYYPSIEPEKGAGTVERGGLEMRVRACGPLRMVTQGPASALFFCRLVRGSRLVRRGSVPIPVPV
jgi:hypothetical protein